MSPAHLRPVDLLAGVPRSSSPTRPRASHGRAAPLAAVLFGALVGCFGALVGCGPAPTPVVAPAPTVTAAAPTVTATAVAAPAPPPPEALPPMHPCVPDFIQKDLHACEAGAASADYSAVANAMTAMTKAGPSGPRPAGKAPVQRPLEPLEEKAASTARAFLCVAPKGEPDDDHATAAFDLGRLYMNANHHEEAALYLRDVAVLDPQKHAEVEYAARFLLESVRALAKSRPECVATYDAMSAAIEAHVCKGPGAADRAESCVAIAKAKSGAPAP